MRCQPCQNLTLSRLVTLAEDEFTGLYEFPSSRFYRHHTSIHALRHSAPSGCELCSLLLKALPSDDDVRNLKLDTEAMSDIRIAISSSHVSHGTHKTSNVRMFDYLLVRPGERYSGSYVPRSLLLLSPAGTAVGRYHVGRDILDSRLSAPSNFAIMRGWLDQCTSKHQACADLQRDVLLPTRVVDVGGDGADFAPFLLVSDGTARGRYAALTHCWGGYIDIVLTNENLEDFQQQLPVESLAKNFKDALRICRGLGVQYLWIDCLCIIQNSEDDWTAESSKMASIYSNAFVTISALASHGSSSGIFRDHHTRRSDDLGLRPASMRIVRDLSQGVTIGLASSHESNELAYALPVDSYPSLESLQWLYKSADGLPTGNEYEYPGQKDVHFAYALQGFSEVAMHPLPYGRSNIYDRGGYHHLIWDYSNRNRTEPSEKLPAFSALAEHFHANMGGNYLAGQFTEQLHSDLLWFRSGRSRLNDGVYPEYVAPSWSWASAYGEVGFFEIHRNFVLGDHTTSQRQLRLLDSKIRYRDETSPYGQVLPGSSIIVAGLTTRLVLNKQIALSSEWISGQRPKGMRLSYLRWDRRAGECQEEQVLFGVSSKVSEGETCSQQSRGFYVATKDTFKSEPGDLAIPQPNDGNMSIPPELCMEDEFLILVVTPEDLDRDMHAYCLFLRKTDKNCDTGQHGQQALVYQRVGILTPRKLHEAVDWEEMTLEII